MAGSRVNNYSPSTTDLTSVMETLDETRPGFLALSLTNESSSLIPAIASGSLAECGGALYSFSTEEPISTATVVSTAENTWYVQLVPSSSQCTAQFSTTTPAWRTDYNGFYYSTASNNRYVGHLRFRASAYYQKSMQFKHYCVAYPTSSVQVTGKSSNSVIFPLDGIEIDDMNQIVSTNAFCPNTAGYYHFEFKFFPHSSASGFWAISPYIQMLQNGSTIVATVYPDVSTLVNDVSTELAAGLAAPAALSHSPAIFTYDRYLSTSDYIQFYVGNGLNVQFYFDSESQLSVQKVYVKNYQGAG